MKITANRKEEVLRRKAEYDAAMDAYNQDSEARWHSYRVAERELLDPIQDTLSTELNKFNLLQFDVRVNFNYRDVVDVRISCNENRKWEDSVALAWSYEVMLAPDGTIKKETSSWSGMQATTREQLDSLKQSVGALEYLLDVDWEHLLAVSAPNPEDFMRDALTRPPHQDFTSELIAAELEDYIGTDTLVKVQNFESSGYGGRTIYIKLLRETPSQYVVNVLSDWTIENIRNGLTSLDNRYAQRVKKSNINPIVENGKIVTLTL